VTQTIEYPITVVRRSASKQIAAASAAGATVLDVTSKGQRPWIQFSPFYPHRNIPVPMSEGYTTASVEGAWQGLKVFESEGIDRSKLRVVTMKGLKRSVKKHGRVLGHQAGINSTRPLLGKVEARRELYLPLYRWVLEHKLGELVEQIRQMRADRPVVLLDYETNADVFDASSPLSHAQLVKAYVEDRWPA
jgi:hypothetical protein